MIKKEEICFILKNIFKFDSISFHDNIDNNISQTMFVFKKDGNEYGILIDDRIIREVPYKDVAGYISERYIDLLQILKDKEVQ